MMPLDKNESYWLLDDELMAAVRARRKESCLATISGFAACAGI